MRLLELADECQKSSGPNFALECEIGRTIGRLARAFTAKLDDAVSLVPDGWYWRCGHGTLYAGWAHLNRIHPDHCDYEDETNGKAATPALALCAAALRALACPREMKRAGYA